MKRISNTEEHVAAGNSAQMAAPKDLNEKKDSELTNDEVMIQAATMNSPSPTPLNKEQTKV